MAPKRPLALVTGASAGIGAIYAEHLARDGHDLVVVARRRERLDELAQRVKTAHGTSTECVTADLSTRPGIDALCARLETGDVSFLVNNAGFPGYRPFVEVAPATLDELIHIHITAVTRATRAALPAMVKAGHGSVVNIASLLALSGTLPPNPMPFRATYAAAKSYLLTFTQALAGELQLTGVRVQVCLPGVVATEFHHFMPPEARQRLAGMAMLPQDVVEASRASLGQGETVCIPGLDDGSLLDRLGETQRVILGAANRQQLASRYR
jgi:short-subunit dehydrogenase